jgi:hypothetical protein
MTSGASCRAMLRNAGRSRWGILKSVSQDRPSDRLTEVSFLSLSRRWLRFLREIPLAYLGATFRETEARRAPGAQERASQDDFGGFRRSCRAGGTSDIAL